MANETFRIAGLDNCLNLLMQLPPEIVSKNGGVVRKALRKGSLVTLKQAKVNLQAIIDKDANNDSTGALMKSLKTQRSRHPEKVGAGERFVVHPAKAPKVNNMTPNEYGSLLERGDSRQAAQPWMTPAYYSTRTQGAQVVVDESNKLIEEAIHKFESAGGSVLR